MQHHKSVVMMIAVALVALLGVASGAPSWKIIDSDIATIDTGISFTSDTVGYAATVNNGVGPQVCAIALRFFVGFWWPTELFRFCACVLGAHRR